MVLLTLTLAGLALYILYSLAVRKHEYWARRGVRFMKPTFFFGSMIPAVFKTKPLSEHFQDIYNELKSSKFGGFYEFLTPQFMPTQPELIREICVKHFDHFHNRRIITNDHADPLLNRALMNLRDAEWQEMRHLLSPAFTASKLRAMFPLIERCGQQFSKFLLIRKNREPIEFKSAFTRLTNDVIASVAFGVECDAISNPEERFYKLGRKLLEIKGVQMLVVFGYMLAPRLMKWFNIPFISREAGDFFRNTIHDTMTHRRKNAVSRPDMLQLLMQAQQGGIQQDDEQHAATQTEQEARLEANQRTVISNDDISSQAFIFFLAGFETVATTLSFMTHELAVNLDVQQRLRDEVDAAILENDGKLTYDVVQNLKYLDMVVSETLRKYPAAGFTDRTCTKDFTIPGTDVVIEKDTIVLLPIFPLHRDPEYFPDPTCFDPERFSAENKDNIKPYTYLPFGTGPHSCIGMRLALLEVKVATCYLLATCQLQVCAKTQVPIQLSKSTFQMTTDAGFWLYCDSRERPSIVLE